MKKLLALLLSLCMLAVLCAGCGSTQEAENDFEGATIRLAGLKGPTSIGMVKLLADNEAGATINTYEFTMAGAADELTPKFLQGELDILAAPVNLGAVLCNNSEGAVQMLAINTLGVTYIVEKGDSTVSSWPDLKGQTIYATGKGSTPEYALRYLLQQNGLDPDVDVTIEWKSEPTEVVGLMASQNHVIAMMPQPFVTVASGKFDDLQVVLNMTEDWSTLDNGGQLITAGIFVRTAFARENPQAVATFLQEYAASTAYVNENVADAAQLVGQYEIVDAAIAEKAIPQCNIVCITGPEMKLAAEGFYQILFEQNPKAIGGALPGEDFYWVQEDILP
ncbi:MAG: ABC transporter substrate-binding protein [Ruminiclostridium sp.]|nr:ABC transporter substrate-binding protein [Ruminiclostridium sp.]